MGYRGSFVWKMTRWKKMDKLKAEIRLRLCTEDYTCRIPRAPKPRVRYKLKLRIRHETWELVYC